MTAPEQIHLPPIKRYNGKLYRPRMLRAVTWENTLDSDFGALVFGTHDVALAQPLADDLIKREFGNHLAATKPQIGWARDTFYGGNRMWEHDPDRGRAAVWFTADEPEHAEPRRAD